MFYFDFSTDLGITLSQFGFALGLQMFLWGAFAPWFGVITDKYGGHIAVFIGFIFYLLGVLMLTSEFNTGLYFVTGIGVLIGIALGGTAISIPVSVVAKHFHDSNRTAAIGIVTAAGSFGYFVSPVFTRFSLTEFGWESTLLIFAAFIISSSTERSPARKSAITNPEDCQTAAITMVYIDISLLTSQSKVKSVNPRSLKSF